MEYLFGTVEKNGNLLESLRTKGETDTDLSKISGKQEVIQKYPDMTVTDSFVVTERYRTDTDSEGNYYNWYVIMYHNRYIDRFTAGIQPVESEILAIQEQLLEATMTDVNTELL